MQGRDAAGLSEVIDHCLGKLVLMLEVLEVFDLRGQRLRRKVRAFRIRPQRSKKPACELHDLKDEDEGAKSRSKPCECSVRNYRRAFDITRLCGGPRDVTARQHADLLPSHGDVERLLRNRGTPADIIAS